MAMPAWLLMMVMPWSARVPETSTASPGRARLPEISQRCETMPMPAVLMNSRSALPCGTTLVSPVTTATPAASEQRPTEAITRSSSASGNPSSMIRARLKAIGRAPRMHRSLMVPCTARAPMSPPGKKSGSTT